MLCPLLHGQIVRSASRSSAGERSPTAMKMISAMPANTPTARNTAMSNTFISVLDLNNLPDDQAPKVMLISVP